MDFLRTLVTEELDTLDIFCKIFHRYSLLCRAFDKSAVAHILSSIKEINLDQPDDVVDDLDFIFQDLAAFSCPSILFSDGIFEHLLEAVKCVLHEAVISKTFIDLHISLNFINSKFWADISDLLSKRAYNDIIRTYPQLKEYYS